MRFSKPYLMAIPALLVSGSVVSQDVSKTELGEIHGNFEVTAQTYNEDSLIGAATVPEKSGVNSFLNLIYTRGKFTAGARLEAYMPPLQGFDPRFGTQRIGLPYRFASYATDGLEVTVGNFYEQFGNGLVLRAYEERGLGLDNAMDGVRVRFSPVPGVYLKGLIGDQRYYWQKSDGLVRGFDGELALNELLTKYESSKLRISLGGSFVSKFQQDRRTNALTLPENVAAWASRMNLYYGGFTFIAEYARKFNDPSSDNNFIYREGEGFFASTGYSRKGFGVTLSAKSIDNMSFRSDRTASLNDVFINYLPALTRQHVYNLAATLYPYATQPNGEIAFQGDLIYTIKRGSKLGGKYGTTIQLNASMANGHDTNQLSSQTELLQMEYLPSDPGRKGYETDLFSFGDEVYYRDYNIEISRKFTKWFSLKASYVHLEYNMDKVQGTALGENVIADIGILDALFRVSSRHSLRFEAQHLSTEQDQGNWAFALLEYGYSPHWFITVLDQYNYNNPVAVKRLHYPTVQVAYIHNASRISLGYGRQRAGIFCVGGVCRNVPAANGLTLSVTTSF